MSHARSKTRSEGQIIEKPFEHSRSHSFGPIFIEIGQDRIEYSFASIFMKLYQNVCLDNGCDWVQK